MKKSYGIPYKGSKNGIATAVLDFLPPADTFVDLFCGGCSITHAVMENVTGIAPKWNKIIANDIDPMPMRLFRDALSGNLPDESTFISRADFQRLKNSDAYVRYVWSFGNNGLDYLYSMTQEAYKKALHQASVCGNYEDFDLFHVVPAGKRGGGHLKQYLREHREEVAADYKAWLDPQIRDNFRCERLWECEHMERRRRLMTIGQTIVPPDTEFSNLDYRAVQIPKGACVYCDIPYENTNQRMYSTKFDHKAFYDWAAAQPFPVYISSYNIPDGRFTCVWSRQKERLANIGNGVTTERIYTQKVQNWA